ncbi:hypothetical protein [Schleiferilactobacillus shenzhenensis]|uniref:PARP catalytic domain-containing protein n=1 Tax=Schleiferilactobacillus shenzhenensis LY-73 TaxID=1231336 RepID=U4TTP0_9LACO|nr:hypothetical protein [Schleiferilactobacillus shenzhenensis]ERL65258.1 hypothetical protein L248_2933 [Schleiferilactobacillus shenzhenensis LY-73]
MLIIGYHGTSFTNAREIVKYGFSADHFPRWTGDLGSGVYGYIQATDRPFATAEYNAAVYVALKADMHRLKPWSNRPKYGKPKTAVVQFKVDVYEDDVCDFTDYQPYDNFVELKARLGLYIHARMPFSPGASYRDNEDGWLIEYLIQKRLVHDYAVFQMDTYSPFVSRSSNFANGREICVRRLETISNLRLI